MYLVWRPLNIRYVAALPLGMLSQPLGRNFA